MHVSMLWITLNAAINYLSSYYSMLGWLRPRFSLSLFFFTSCDKLAFAIHSWEKRVWIWQNKKMRRRETESKRKSGRDTLQAIVSYWNASMFALRYHSNSTPLGGRRVNEWAGMWIGKREGEKREKGVQSRWGEDMNDVILGRRWRKVNMKVRCCLDGNEGTEQGGEG